MSDAPLRSDRIEISQVTDGYVVYDPEVDRVHYLNHTAAVILELCNGENTADDIVRMVTAVYGLPERAEDEVNDCLEGLRNEGLIR